MYTLQIKYIISSLFCDFSVINHNKLKKKRQKHGLFEKNRPEAGVCKMLINSKNLPRPEGVVYFINCFFARPGGWLNTI